jgi:hypothetical protein
MKKCSLIEEKNLNTKADSSRPESNQQQEVRAT